MPHTIPLLESKGQCVNLVRLDATLPEHFLCLEKAPVELEIAEAVKLETFSTALLQSTIRCQSQVNFANQNLKKNEEMTTLFHSEENHQGPV